MNTFNITWKFLIDHTPDPKPTENQSSVPTMNPKHNPKTNPTKNTSNNSGKCLAETNNTSNNITKPSIAVQKQEKTFAQAVTNLCDIPSYQLPQPILKGDNFSFEIPEDDYDDGMTACKFNLYARVIWPKGSTPLIVHALCSKLATMWKDMSQWGIYTR